MADQQIGIKVPQELIEDIVRAEVVRALGGQAELMEGIVRAALMAKKDSYSRITLFEEKVQEMIREVANGAVSAWVLESKEKIQAAFIKHLQSRDGQAIKKLVEGMVDGLSKYSVSVNFNWPRE